MSDPLNVVCHECNAQPGHDCLDSYGDDCDAHLDRVIDALSDALTTARTERDEAVASVELVREAMRQAQEHATRLLAERDEAVREAERMRPVYEAAVVLAEYIRKYPDAPCNQPPGDWACAECIPHSDMLIAGFRCAHHGLLHTTTALAGKGTP